MLIQPTRRAAFTLVELLVVISIIVVLVALTATAAFAVRRGAQKSNAEASLTKLDQILQRKVKDMTDRVREDVDKSVADAPTILAACNNNKEVARAIMLYARLRRDLPMTFAEARSNFTVCGYTYRASKVFDRLPATGTGDFEESAACLHAALTFDGTDGLEQQITTGLGTGQPVFVDGFGAPVAFVRLGYDGNQNELNSPPFVPAPAAANTFDPFYPNKFSNNTYRNLATDFGGAAAFQTQVWNAVRPNVPWLNTPANYPGPKNHATFVFSAGYNNEFLEPPSNTIYDGDNLFSYRLRREGAQGD